MSSSDSAVFGIYGKADEAGTAVDFLLSMGFSASEISVVLPGNGVTRAFVLSTTNAAEGQPDGIVLRTPRLENPGEFEVPDVGLLIAAGPMMTMLTGVVARGSAGRHLAARTSSESESPEYEAKLYEGAVGRKEDTLLSVRCGNQTECPAPKMHSSTRS